MCLKRREQTSPLMSNTEIQKKCYFQEIAKTGDLSHSLVKSNPFLDHTVVFANIFFSGVCMSELCWTIRLSSRPDQVTKNKRNLSCLVLRKIALQVRRLCSHGFVSVLGKVRVAMVSHQRYVTSLMR
jgi:hypothetical protein